MLLKRAASALALGSGAETFGATGARFPAKTLVKENAPARSSAARANGTARRTRIRMSYRLSCLGRKPEGIHRQKHDGTSLPFAGGAGEAHSRQRDHAAGGDRAPPGADGKAAAGIKCLCP